MLVLFVKATQLGLFDAPVRVHAHTRDLASGKVVTVAEHEREHVHTSTPAAAWPAAAASKPATNEVAGNAGVPAPSAPAAAAAVVPAAPAGPKLHRWFVRCDGCLSVSMIERPKGKRNEYLPDGFDTPAQTVKCGLCDGRVKVMGRVIRHGKSLLTDTTFRTPCDDRCTNAPGPKCECQCGGENHGTGRLVEVKHEDKIPKVHPIAPEAARQRAAEFTSAYEHAKARLPYRGIAERKAAGEYLERSEYGLWVEREGYAQALRHAKGLTSHKGRMKAIAELEKFMTAQGLP